VEALTKDVEDAESHLEHLRQKAASLTMAAARIPKLELELETLRTAFYRGTHEDRKRVVAAVIERMEADLLSDTITVRVRAA
jgi:hypothetical protein